MYVRDTNAERKKVSSLNVKHMNIKRTKTTFLFMRLFIYLFILCFI